MNELRTGEHDILSYFRPDTLIGASFYFAVFLLLALLVSRALRTTVRAAMTREGHIDRTTISFIQQLGTVIIWAVMIILYAHLIPALRAMGTALLAGAGVASIVIGMAAQSTLGNLVAGIAITIYRPFRLGDTLQIVAPTGNEIGVVDRISLGYTRLLTPDARFVVLPNSVAASQITINLGKSFVPGQIAVAIRISRELDVEQARALTLVVAAETLGEQSIESCLLKKLEGADAVLELKARVPDPANRESMRATLLARLAHRFEAAKTGEIVASRASFS
ncbi:MAG TPA: mechanosensitive ion channel family protein [Steroidobacteraceae bacterium]